MVSSKKNKSIKQVKSKKVKVNVENKKQIKLVKPVVVKSKVVNPLSKLKEFEVMKKDYELTDDILTVNSVMHKMSEIIEFYLKLIQQILQPEEFHAVYECNAFNDVDKSKLFELYRRLIIAHRELLKAVVMNDEKNSVIAIQFVHEEIKSVKPQMLEIVNKIQGSWKKGAAEVQKGPKQYFG
jgi:hypothetical protein